jgi:L-asparaginase
MVDGGDVVFRRRPMPRPTWHDAAAEPGIRVRRLEPRVDLVQAFTGMTDRPLRHAIEDGAKGLAVVAFGRGNVPPTIVPAIRDAVASGVLVTVSSRSLAGRVSARYGYDGGGLQLRNAGAVLSGDLSGAQARLLQMVTLGLTNGDPIEAAKLIHEFQ